MAKDYETGDVFCDGCGKHIGNYMYGDFHKYIRKKYCDECRKQVEREQQRYRSQKYRRTFKQYKSKIREEISIKDNELRTLRKMVGIESKTIEIIKEEMLHKRGYVVIKNQPIKCSNCGDVQEGGYPFCRTCGVTLSQKIAK